MIEQTEGGDTDHNIIAVPVGEPVPDLAEVKERVGYFVARFMVGVPGRESVMGRLLPVDEAFRYLEECTEAHRTRR